MKCILNVGSWPARSAEVDQPTTRPKAVEHSFADKICERGDPKTSGASNVEDKAALYRTKAEPIALTEVMNPDLTFDCMVQALQYSYWDSVSCSDCINPHIVSR